MFKDNKMKLTAGKISDLIDGEIQGNASVTISSFADIKSAKKGDITFCYNNAGIKHMINNA